MKWLKEEDTKLKTLYAQGLDFEEIASRLEKSVDAVRGRYKRLKAGHNLDDVYQDNEAKVWKDKYRSLAKLKAVEERMLEHFIDNIKPFSPHVSPVVKRSSEGTKEAAVLLLSDLHVGQVVLPSQTQNFGNYNPSIFLDRLSFLEESLISILSDKVGNPVDSLYIVMLGDFLHGVLNHQEEQTNSLLLVDQFALAVWSISQFLIRVSLALDIPVFVKAAAVGNHSRLPSQRKMPTTNRHSNFDQMLYHAIAAVIETSKTPAIKFELTSQPGAIFDVKGTKISGRHGDHLTGGDQVFGVPAHSMAREVLSSTLRHTAAKLSPPELYVCGDKHKSLSLPLPSGKYIINSSFVGVDDFSLAANFTPQDPAQLLFGIHPKYKMTWSYEIKLKFAPVLKEIPYDLPEDTKQLVMSYK